MVSTGKLVFLPCWSPKNVFMLWKSFLLVFLLKCDVSLGKIDTSIDCMDGGYPGRSTNLTCTLTGTVMYNGIYWLRPSAPEQVSHCNTDNTQCLTDVPGYTSVINSPTQITLIITSFNTATDAGEWRCIDGLDDKGLSSCNLTVQRGPVRGSITFSSTIRVEEGEDLTVNCSVDCNPPCNYSWILDNEEITSRPLLRLKDVNTNHDENVYECTVTNVALLTSISKIFMLTVTDAENMSAFTAGILSGLMIAIVLSVTCTVCWVLYKRKKLKKENDDGLNECTTKET
ncbi:hepatocyte cell adhesion molecule-like [Gigantopelta aegis]|uniref:hepatocyte cell adhesion molecule-like n=1 Tax=Gigantopelta aegis TaxID=1735272 RepID=UPI001B88E41E|nr:hepatocyte cell adhesion molecule-like [Gigantopelta aegis]